MKKKVLSLALIAMSLLSTSAIAQNPSSNTTSSQIENVKQMKDGKKMMKGERKGNRPQKNPYEGLTLTEAQKTQLQQLDRNRMEARKQQKEARKAEKQRNDSAMRAARKADKIEYLQEVKEIVGPDQYIVFLENMYVNQDGPQKGGKEMQKGGKQFKKGDRDQKHGFAHNKDGKQKKNKDGKQFKGQKPEKNNQKQS